MLLGLAESVPYCGNLPHGRLATLFLFGLSSVVPSFGVVDLLVLLKKNLLGPSQA
jgi:hypothetical protein